ncbi:MAG: hypothetical protein A3F54_01435 [Candidatus Kerfeldbacteria bacterium RIFCSPHIGHO2_12_FULL_48_17]|uniref:ABC transporter domain-containing protein n=1 Tax=Candidatus Kerfeldbacteria bacterium RIFCSPHIGHO2_12_FULL_48_17 TaxID=1798542 RepID=A0A1G2AYW6_9BACT|nr:MAG: hypothetical protein A3F54_01435 [Candidatus Kerfeldbacteria bacterium RIFCSPHIGHO2_12_FULL_48_17]
MKQPIIDIQNLRKTYTYYKKPPGLLGSLKSLFHREKLLTEAVKEVNFSIEQGEFVGFLGPNGAGKTTTLKMLSGILYPTSGKVNVLGFTPWDRKPEFQKQFSLVMGQKNQLWWDLPAMETFLLNQTIYEIPEKVFRASLKELSELLEIQDILTIPVRKLSLGQRMKCELAAALLHQPKVLFLDEPTIGLDVTSQQNIRTFLKKYNEQKKTTILLTSHYMDDIMELCKRVIIVNLGRIVYDGSLQELIDKHADYKLLKITFTQEMKRNDLKKYGKVSEFAPKRAVLHVAKAQYKKIAAHILEELPVDDIFIDEVSVEEVIRDIFAVTKTGTV